MTTYLFFFWDGWGAATADPSDFAHLRAIDRLRHNLTIADSLRYNLRISDRKRHDLEADITGDPYG